MSAPIALRAHNILCLFGYRGRGYDAAFVREMSTVHAALAGAPATLVEVRAAPDRLCGACPNLRGGCTLGGPDHEAHMRAQDEAVAARLRVEPGDVLPWGELAARVRAGVGGRDLPALCTTCPWLSLGWCAEGLERLRASPEAPALVPVPDPRAPN